MSTFAADDGTRLAYTEVGDGPPLVCLPGGPGRASAYLENLGGLTATRRLVRLDSRATGHSEVPADPASLRFDRLAGDVEALRRHLGLESMDLLGHSAGAMVAQAYAAAHGGRLGRLVLLTPSDRLQGGTRSDVEQIAALREGEPWFSEAHTAWQALPSATPAERQALSRATRPFLYGTWGERAQAHAATADTQSSRRAELGFGADGADVAGLLAALRQLSSPVLVVGAQRDAATGLASVDAVADCFPAAERYVIPRAGHFPWVDEPEATSALLDGWLAGRGLPADTGPPRG